LRRDWAVATDESGVGRIVACVGDVDHDGRDEIAHTLSSAGAQLVVVKSGRDRSLLHSWSGLGATSVAGAGDVDADGTPDVIVGSAFLSGNGPFSGAARVLSGATGAVLHHFVGDAGEFLGFAVTGLGDCNGDGHSDVAVSAPRTFRYPNGWEGGWCSGSPVVPGQVRVFSGADGTLLFAIDGQAPVAGFGCDGAFHCGEVFGFAVTDAGDWNRDGTPDLAVGAPAAGSDWSGAARVFSGVDGALLREFLGTTSQAEFGISVDGGPAFDFDADGWVDLVVGEQQIPYGPHASFGAAHVFSGQDGTRLFAGGAPPSPVGYGRPVGPAYAVAALTDFDLDGHSDIAVGSPSTASLLGSGAGTVWIISGADRSLLRIVAGVSSWDYLGYSLAAVGDTDGDGSSEVLMSAPGGDTPSSSSRIRLVRGGSPRSVSSGVGGSVAVDVPR
jgi:hypothetical protein